MPLQSTVAHPRGRSAARSASRTAPLRPLITTWLAWLVVMAGVNLATPLYAVYANRFGFSSLVLTLVFSVYALALVPSLLLFGRLSDRFGRRAVIVAGQLAAIGGLVLFAAAQSTPWLFAARAAQGLAVGTISGAATAALVELDTGSNGRRPALLAGLAQALGSGLGPVAAGTLAQWAPDPLRVCFVVFLALTVVSALVMLILPRTDPAAQESWRVELPRVPRDARAGFARVSLTAAIAWAVAALFISIVPLYASHLLTTHDLALLGAVGALALGASAAAQLVMHRVNLGGPPAQAAGLAALAAGLALLALASPLHSLVVLLAAAVVAGAGHGLAFVNAQDELNGLAPDERRGEVTAAFICCIYLLVAAAVISTGLLDLRLSLQLSVAAVATVLGAAALAAAGWHLRAASA